MPVIVLHESTLVIYGSTRLATPLVALDEWSFDAPEIAGWAVGETMFRRWGSTEKYVKAPPLSKLVPFAPTIAPRPWSTPRRALAVPWDPSGLLAETVAWAAGKGERGFSFLTKEEAMAKQPSLFDLEAPADAPGPYLDPRASPNAPGLLACPAPAVAPGLASITPENVVESITALASMPGIAGDRPLTLAVVGAAKAIARNRGGEVTLATATLEILIEELTGRSFARGGRNGP